MSQEWFVRRGENEKGPLTPQDVKRLAAKGIIVATDMVRTSEKPEWRQAGTVKGLFETRIPLKPVPPPLPKSEVESPTDSVPPPPATSSAIPQAATSSQSTANFADTVQAGSTDLVSTAKQAKDLVAAHARRTQVINVTLPKAYLELGKEVFLSGRFKDQFSDLFERLTATNDEIAKANASIKEMPQATDVQGKLQSGAAQLLAQRKLTKFRLQRESLVRELGKKAFESNGKTAGSPELLSPITAAIEEVNELDTQIKHSSSSKSFPFWQRIPVAILLSIGCFPIGLWLVWKNPRLSFGSKAVWIGGFVAFITCVLIAGQTNEEKRSASKTHPDRINTDDESVAVAVLTPTISEEKSQHVRILEKSSFIVEGTHTTQNLSVSTKGEYLFTELDVLHIQSQKWVLHKNKTPIWMSPSGKKMVTIESSANSDKHRLNVHVLDGDKVTLQDTLPLPGGLALSYEKNALLGYSYHSARYSPDEEYLVVGIGHSQIDGYVVFRTIPHIREVARFFNPRQSKGKGGPYSVVNLREVAFSGTQMFVPLNDRICSFDLSNGNLDATWDVTAPELCQPALKGGSIVAIADRHRADERIEVFGPGQASRRQLLKMKGTVGTVIPDSEEVLLSTSSGVVQFVSTKDGHVSRTSRTPSNRSHTWNVFSRNGRFAVFPSTDGRLHVWSLRDNKPVACVGPVKSDGHNSVAITDDGKIVVVARFQSKIYEVWRVDDGILGPLPASPIESEAPAKSETTYPQYLTLTEIEKKEGWSIPNGPKGKFRQNSPAPPVSAASYLKLKNGMNQFQVAQILSGWPHKSRTDRIGKNIDWRVRFTDVYVGEVKGSIVILVFEDDSSGQSVLVQKRSQGL